MRGRSVLVVDDEWKIRDLVRSYLERAGFVVVEAETGEQALATARRARPDAIVLDLMLPDLPGEEVARSLREVSDVPIVMLTAKSDEDDRVAGLRTGADDYVVKPFSPRELVARVEAVLRRVSAHEPDVASYGDGRLVIDRSAREVTCEGEPVTLTRVELDLLVALATSPGRVWSREELVSRVHGGFDHEGGVRTIDAHVKNLRRKLGDDPRDPRWIATVTGVGYKLVVQRDARGR